VRRQSEGARRLADGFVAIPRADLVGAVARQIEQAIIEGRLAPGQRLVEADLARRLETSRAPVREAARLLEQRGLLVQLPRRGFFVRSPTVQELDDLYPLRIHLEKFAAGQAVLRATSADIDRLRAQLDRIIAAAEAGAPGQAVEEDLRFHQLLCAVSGNGKLQRVFADLAGEVRLVILLIGQIFDDPLRIAETHRPLIECLEARDGPGLEAAIDYHIRVAWDEVRALFEAREAEGRSRAGRVRG